MHSVAAETLTPLFAGMKIPATDTLMEAEAHSGSAALTKYAGPLILLLAGGWMVSISWLKWQDLLIDFGEQAYIPWALSKGQVLYKDFEYQFGPLSVYAHALLFKLFGPGILTLAVFNILIVAGLASLIYIFFLRFSDRLTATVLSLAFITLFALGQYKGGGNFNFVGAYAYQLPHGVALSFLALFWFYKYSLSQADKHLAAVFFLAGCVYLTKPEVFLALTVALAGGLTALFVSQQRAGRRRPQTLGVALASLLAAPFIFLIYLWGHMPFNKAAMDLLGPWIYVMNSSHRSIPYYQWVMGIDAVGPNLSKMFLYLFQMGLVILALAAVNRLLPRLSGNRGLFSGLLVALAFGLTLTFQNAIDWFELLRPLPAAALGLSGFYAYRYCKNTEERPRHLALFTFGLFSFVLLFKIILNTHIYHYGFALALPATLLVLFFLLQDFPKLKFVFPQSANFYRPAVLMLVLVFIGKHVSLGHQLHQLKTYPVGRGTDTILDYDAAFETRGTVVNQALQYIQTEMDPEAEFAPLPLGNILNYL
ncbi:MAG: hypothetical protein GWM98_18955, partial [Nitrospinaceae bacterium]|nr:hypothetical protein [Nitrospinaceae bacterium]NIR56182.1 hypothetical protein [Nitrospinaceae bacterium]NIX35835.1 hypothetical protein [Nitrospinaceae bacterium]NIY16820.1 hypothetical protein [Nitrospinaceae bacterium]